MKNVTFCLLLLIAAISLALLISGCGKKSTNSDLEAQKQSVENAQPLGKVQLVVQPPENGTTADSDNYSVDFKMGMGWDHKWSKPLT